MSERPAPVDSIGLVKVPRVLDCVGISCPVKKSIGYCFPDEHHFYSPEDKFDNGTVLMREFKNDRHNRIMMARCRHNSASKKAWHSKYDFSLVPPEDVMVTFLDESAILADLGVTVKNMARIVLALTTLNMRERTQAPTRSYESLQKWRENLDQINGKLHNFTVVPQIIVGNVIKNQQEYLETLCANAGNFAVLQDVTADYLQPVH